MEKPQVKSKPPITPSQVLPGDTIVFRCDLMEPIRRGIAQMKGIGMVGEKIVVEAEMMAQISKVKDIETA